MNKWEPRPSDAISLATIRWFALMMEAKAIEIYGTNPGVYPKIQEVLGKCLSEVSDISPRKTLPIPGIARRDGCRAAKTARRGAWKIDWSSAGPPGSRASSPGAGPLDPR
jgi:hypothetical protein